MKRDRGQPERRAHEASEPDREREQAFQELADRVAALEERAEEIDRRAELVEAARRSWRVQLQTRDTLVLASDAGDLARVPVAVARVLAAGRSLDLDIHDRGDEVELADGDEVVATVSRAAFLALPKALSGWRGATSATPSGAQSQSHPSRSATPSPLSVRQSNTGVASAPVAPPATVAPATTSSRTPSRTPRDRKETSP